MQPQWSKILIIKLRAIGDVIMTTPFFSAVRKAFPLAQIDFLVEKAAYPLVEAHPALDHVWLSSNKLRDDWRLIRKLRRQQYDVCFDLFGNPRSALLTLLSGAKERVGFDFRGRKVAYNVRIPSRAAEIHEVDFNLDALRHFGLQPEREYPFLVVGPDARQKAARIWDELGLASRFVVALNPAGSWPAKRWPLASFIQLGRRLAEQRNARILVLWGPGERNDAEQVQAGIGAAAVIHPPTTLAEQAALLARCQLFIGNDSGPMHLSAAMGVPTLGIYGPTNARLQSPVGPYARAIFNPDVPCLGCNRLECPLMDCMNELTPEMVFAAAEKLLQEVSDPAPVEKTSKS